MFSTVAAPIYVPTNSEERSLFSTPCPAFVICRLLNDGHSDWCEVIPHCGFDCISLIISDGGYLFMCFRIHK